MSLDMQESWFWPVVCANADGQERTTEVFLVTEIKERTEVMKVIEIKAGGVLMVRFSKKKVVSINHLLLRIKDFKISSLIFGL
jgi:hypothetical protein